MRPLVYCAIAGFCVGCWYLLIWEPWVLLVIELLMIALGCLVVPLGRAFDWFAKRRARNSLPRMWVN